MCPIHIHRLTAEIEAMHSRTLLVASYEICCKKKIWMEFEELYLKYNELEADLKNAKE